MMDQVRNIYCVGRNYVQHAAELGNELPTYPMFFTKPTHALVPMNGQSIPFPANRGQIHYEAEIVLRVGRSYERGISVDNLIDQMAVGIDFTLRDVQDELKQKGHPWLAAKGFLNSAPVGSFRPFVGVDSISEVGFSLLKNGECVQKGKISEMIFSPQVIIDYCAAHYGLAEGDLIYTGTPAGVGAVANGDQLQLYWGNEPAGSCKITLEG